MAKISSYASKTTPVDADSVVAIDSAASNATKRFTWANIKAAIKTYYDSVSATLTTKTIALGSNTVTGTKAQFDTAVTDGNFLYVGDVSLASTTEVLTGTDAAKSVTPDALAALWEKGSNVASAGTISLGEGGFFHITGTTTITDIDFATDKNGRWAWLVFDAALTLTHNASTLILPTGANITTAAGDCALIISEGSDVVKCVYYSGRFATVRTAGDVNVGNNIGIANSIYFGALNGSPRADGMSTTTLIRWLDASASAGCGHVMMEMTEPAAPAANSGTLFLVDNGSGKTVLKIRFASGASQQIAIEP